MNTLQKFFDPIKTQNYTLFTHRSCHLQKFQLTLLIFSTPYLVIINFHVLFSCDSSSSSDNFSLSVCLLSTSLKTVIIGYSCILSHIKYRIKSLEHQNAGWNINGDPGTGIRFPKNSKTQEILRNTYILQNLLPNTEVSHCSLKNANCSFFFKEHLFRPNVLYKQDN